MHIRRFTTGISLSISLIGIATSYTINQDCATQRDDVNTWISEARFMFDRAAKVLSGSKLTAGGYSPNVMKILQSCLGTKVSESEISSIQNAYITIVQNLASKNSDGSADIDFRCTDPEVTVTGFFPTDADPAGSKASNEFVHPVLLSRIKGTKPTDGRKSTVWFVGDASNTQYLFPINGSPSTSLAYTYQPSTRALGWQKTDTGSDHLWSDIVLNTIKTKVATVKGTFKVAVPNWGVDALNSAKFSLLMQDPASITIMHELTHSIAMGPGNDINGHVKLASGRSVNGIKNVFQTAQDGVSGLTKNPDTLAWLAVLLCMPWLKWLDDSKTPFVIDGVARWNTYESQGTQAFDIPLFLRDHTGALDAQDTTNFARGPYAFT